MLEQIYYGVSCQPTDLDELGKLVAHFGFFPTWTLLFNSFLSLIDDDLYFFIASNSLLLLVYGYMHIVAQRLGVERPSAYDYELCSTTQYAFPDPTFVSTMAYTIVITIGLYFDARTRRQMSWLRILTLLGAVVLYCASTLLTGYFYLWQFVANSLLAALVAALFVFVYQFAAAHLWLDAGETARCTMHRLRTLSGYAGNLFTYRNQSATQTTRTDNSLQRIPSDR